MMQNSCLGSTGNLLNGSLYHVRQINETAVTLISALRPSLVQGIRLLSLPSLFMKSNPVVKRGSSVGDAEFKLLLKSLENHPKLQPCP